VVYGGRRYTCEVNGLGEESGLGMRRKRSCRAGDLLCSASTPGYAMKQDVEADIVRSYTVAKQR
jgi:hypothetical protein